MMKYQKYDQQGGGSVKKGESRRGERLNEGETFRPPKRI